MTTDERALLDMVQKGILRIDEDGLIWRCQKKHKEWDGYRECTPTLLGHEAHGYIRIVIRDEDGQNVRAYAHRLVYMWFYEDIPEGIQVNHKDGNGHNNSLDNLELMTPSQQMIHAVNVLGRKVGNRTHKPRHFKINPEEREKIRRSGLSQTTLARMYGVTQARISQIKNEGM